MKWAFSGLASMAAACALSGTAHAAYVAKLAAVFILLCFLSYLWGLTSVRMPIGIKDSQVYRAKDYLAFSGCRQVVAQKIVANRIQAKSSGHHATMRSLVNATLVIRGENWCYRAILYGQSPWDADECFLDDGELPFKTYLACRASLPENDPMLLTRN